MTTARAQAARPRDLRRDGGERVRLRFEPDGAEVRVPSGTPIFDAASWNGVAIDSTCGGHGTCKKCKVRVLDGDVPVEHRRPARVHARRAARRLAARVPRAGARRPRVEVPPLQTRPKAALVGVGRHVILRPAVQKRHLVLEEPSLEDQRSDLQRVLDAIDDLEPHVELDGAATLGKVLREAQFDVTAVVVRRGADRGRAGRHDARRYAIAFDLGTTTVVATLLDLETGQPSAVQLDAQPPAAVRRRCDHARLGDDDRRPDALGALQARAHETLAELAGEVCEEAGVDPGEVYEIVVSAT